MQGDDQDNPVLTRHGVLLGCEPDPEKTDDRPGSEAEQQPAPASPQTEREGECDEPRRRQHCAHVSSTDAP
jgi:hypothetical protein